MRANSANATKHIQQVDLDTIEHEDVRSVGGENLALHALEQLKFPQLLQRLKLGKAPLKCALARMVHPASERETHRWLTQDSAFAELVNLNPLQLKRESLYRSVDTLWRHKSAIEKHLFSREQELFSVRDTTILYYLTNTWFTGRPTHALAHFGRSKEKHNDCRLVTLGLCLDANGFLPHRSEVLNGNVSEPATLKEAITRLSQSAHGLTVVMDAGVATKANIEWLKDNNYDWIVVNRSREWRPDTEPATLESKIGTPIKVWRLKE